jgi:hypothetical protein
MRKEIPYRKIMRAVRFRPSEIDRWIDGGGLEACGKTDGGLFEEVGAAGLEIQETGGGA